MPKLPSMINASRITRSVQTEFGSYNHTTGASNGDIYDMKNLSSDSFPLLTVRKKRTQTGLYLGGFLGFCNHGGLFYIYRQFLDLPEDSEGNSQPRGIYFVDASGENEVRVRMCDEASGDEPERTLCGFGKYIVIMPDKKYYDTETKTIGNIESYVIAMSGTIHFQNGYLYGENAVANTLYYDSNDKIADHFKEGDAVTISGCEKHPENNGTFIIRQIDAERDGGHTLSFYENTFTLNNGNDYFEDAEITIKREMPDLEFMCENENRLWGCKGSTVYASKLGDIFNWNVYDGISTDSFSVSVGSPGDFTGCISYLGYPCFFKEDYIYKMYGDKPSNFQLMSTASSGVSDGCGKSLAIAGETLFYMSRNGICAYTGGMPVNISRCFGDVVYSQAVGGSDGIKYYVSLKNENDKYGLFVYDTRYRVWHKEDDAEAIAFARIDGVLYMVQAKLSGASVVTLNGENGDVEDDIEWMCEFADIYEYSSSRSVPSKKGIVRFYIRAELEDGAYMDAEIKYDSEDKWQKIGTVNATKKRTCILPIIPRRADHIRLRLSGKGKCTVYSITREYYGGSFI